MTQQLQIGRSKEEAEEQGKRTLKTAGYSYIIGDVAMATAGYMRSKDAWASVSGAVIWAMGGLGAAIYGNPNLDKQLEIQSSKLERYLQKRKVKISDEARAHSPLLRKHTAWRDLQEFLYQHPSELLNGAYAIGSAFLLGNGLVRIHKRETDYIPGGRRGKGLDKEFWAGTLVGTGSLIGLIAQEKTTEPQEQTTVKRKKHTVKEAADNPLKIAAGLYLVNNLVVATQAISDFNARHTDYPGQKFYKQPFLYAGIQLASYVFANLLLFSSSKSQITKKGFGVKQMAKFEDAYAYVVVDQAPDMQQKVLNSISHFMAAQDGVKDSAEEIAEALTKRVAEIKSQRQPEAVPAETIAQQAIAKAQSSSKLAVVKKEQSWVERAQEQKQAEKTQALA